MTQTDTIEQKQPSRKLSGIAAHSIRTKLALIVAMGFLITFTVAFYLMSVNIQKMGAESQAKSENLIAELLVGQMQAPVQFKDGARLASIYAPAIENDPALQWIDITHATGEKLSIHSGSEMAPQQLESLIARALDVQSAMRLKDGDIYLVSMPIFARDGESLLGVASFVWDIGILLNAQEKQVRLVLLVSAIVGLAGLAAIVFAISRLVTSPIGALSDAMAAVAERDYKTEVVGVAREDEIGVMASKLSMFRDTLAQEDRERSVRREETALRQKLFQKLAEQMSKLANGHTDCHIDVNEFVGLDEDHKKICQNFNEVLDNLRKMLSTIVSTAESVRTSAHEISETAEDQSKRSEAQAATLEESAAAIEGLNSSVQKTASLAADANTRIADNKKLAAAGGEVVDRTVKAMRDIEVSSQQITAIIGVIDDIAFQTNLLALNAGVEAARAGESGRGFAVVASEVRALAQRASDSANEIKELILRSSEHVTEGSELANQAGSALSEIIDGVNHLSDLVGLIATGSSEQATNLSEIKESVNDLDSVTQQNAAVIEESSAASRSLSHEAERMTDALRQFPLNSGSGPKDHAVSAPPAGPSTWAEDIAEMDSTGQKNAATANPVFSSHKSGSGKAVVNATDDDWEEF